MTGVCFPKPEVVGLILSAVDWDILSKFGAQIELDRLKYLTSPNPKPEVDMRRRGRIFKGRYDVRTCRGGPF